MLIIARTDARQTEGFEGAMQARRRPMREAGADIVFLEALESEAEMREACERIRQADDGEHGRRRKDADPLEDRAGGDRLRARDLPVDHRACGRRRRSRTRFRVFKAEGTSDSPNCRCSISANSRA